MPRTHAATWIFLLALFWPCYAQVNDAVERAMAADRAFRQGEQFHQQGRLREAIPAFQTALQLRQSLNDARSSALILDILAAIHHQLGEKQTALEYFQQVLTIRRNDSRDEAATLHNLGVLYSELGDKRQALQHFESAVYWWRQVRDQRGLAATLNATGSVYSWAGQKETARQFYEEALLLKRVTKDRGGEAYVRNNLGAIWSALGDKRKARDQFQAALAVWRELQDRQGQALALTNLGVVFTELNERQKAVEQFQQALLLGRSNEARTLGNLGFVYALMDDKVRALATLQQSLALARQANNPDAEAASLTHLMLAHRQFKQPGEAIVFGKLAINSYQQLRANVQDALQQSFVQSKADAYRTLAELLIEAGRLLEAQAVLRMLKEQEYFEYVRGDDDSLTPRRIALTTEELEIIKGTNKPATAENLMSSLMPLEPGTAAVFTIVGAEKYRVLVFKSDARVAREYEIKASELNHKIFAFREALNARRPDFMQLSRELYRILVAPIRQDLSDTKTVLWSLDGALRYVPLAALHDGKKYLVESYSNVVQTLSSRLHDPPCKNWRGLGLGLSKAVAGFPSLAHVPAELSSIIRSSANSKGALDGRLLLNETFTETTMKAELKNHYPAVHIASHFKFEPGNETDSYLVLGDGSPLTVAQLKAWQGAFTGVELLTLSACETGVGDGRELESFGEIAQRQGAKAVIATLLRVPDQSAAVLMPRFYQLRATMSKAEALRQAQLEILQSEQFKHPAFWSPYILFGNFQ
ncbi:MAG: CHAT domain-containing protein [Blastocatellia bacterium]|nr:CHAT domain-containing protein [Blastocatellia bacterium]